MTERSRRLLVAICLLGALLRLTCLFQPIRYDEAVTWTEFASRPFVEVVSSYTDPKNHVFHTFLVKVAAAAGARVSSRTT